MQNLLTAKVNFHSRSTATATMNALVMLPATVVAVRQSQVVLISERLVAEKCRTVSDQGLLSVWKLDRTGRCVILNSGDESCALRRSHVVWTMKNSGFRVGEFRGGYGRLNSGIEGFE